MVFKLTNFIYIIVLWFENDVKMYGIQTRISLILAVYRFENDVKMYGIQTDENTMKIEDAFENDVKMYGIQTLSDLQNYRYGV